MGPFPFIISNDGVTVVIGTKSYDVDASNANYQALKDALRSQDWHKVSDTIDLATAIRTWANGAVQVTESEVFYNGKPLSNGLTNHILNMIRDGFDVTPLTNFLRKLMENPSFNSREQLYRFVDSNKITIHPDGDLILYKNVKRNADGNLVDVRTSVFSNNVGDKPSVDRPTVDDNPNNTCSFGLHVCSLRYLPSYLGDATVLVKVNPKNVVSVPTDYQDSKMRVSTYEVIGLHEKGNTTEATDKSVYDLDVPFDPSDDWDNSNDPYEDGYQEGYKDGYDANY